MAANKTYIVVKDGEELEKLKTLTAAKKLADTQGAKVYCDDECVYEGEKPTPEFSEELRAREEPTEPGTTEEKVPEPVKTQKGITQYRLTSLMNVRKAPSLDAEKAGFKNKGAIVNVVALEKDWLHHTDGTFILFGGGEYAQKL